MKKMNVIYCLAAGLLSIQVAQADTMVFAPATGDWNVPGNWWNLDLSAASATLPGVSDLAIMNGGRVVSVNNAIGTLAGSIQVANEGPGASGGMNVNPGGSLEFQGGLSIGSAGAYGTLNIQGGDLTSVNTGSRGVLQGYNTDSSVSLMNISSGSYTAQGSVDTDYLYLAGMTVNMSGGLLDMSGGHLLPLHNSVINIDGDDSTILMDRLNMAIPDRATSFNFNLDSDGISSVDSAEWMHLAHANITIDGSSYTGGAGTFDLFTTTYLGSTPVNAPVITGFGGGLSASVSQVGENYVLAIVPEPATLSMLAVAGGGLFFMRRLKS